MPNLANQVIDYNEIIIHKRELSNKTLQVQLKNIMMILVTIMTMNAEKIEDTAVHPLFTDPFITSSLRFFFRQWQ